LRLTFLQYLTETKAFRLSPTQIKQAKANMARISQQVLAKEKGRTREREMRVWASTGGQYGWWHPVKDVITFGWSSKNYHVTQIFKNPEKFGISEQEMRKAIDEWKATESMRYTYAASRVFKKNQDDYENVMRIMKDGYYDTMPSVSVLATEKGWVYFSIQGNPGIGIQTNASFGSSRKDSLKAVIREYISVVRQPESIDVMLFNKNRPRDMLFTEPLELNTIAEIEKFLGS